MKLIDTHAHIYSNEFGTEAKELISRAMDAGIERILMPAIDASTYQQMIALELESPGYCLAMAGLHPCSVAPGYEKEMELIEEALRSRKFIGIGETGLDFHWDLTHRDLQYRAFEQQADWALQYDLPLVIHSRKSTDECIEVVARKQTGALKGVFHCFSGTVEQARRIMDLGFYLGIGGVLTFKNSGLDGVLAELGAERLVLETDAPYLAPVPFRGKRNEPAYLKFVAQKLADIYQWPVERVAEITTRNARELFNLGEKSPGSGD